MKLPASAIRSGRLLVGSAALSLVVLGSSAGSARPAATATSGGMTAACQPGMGGHPGSCVDPVGDLKGTNGPDIIRVDEYEWGAIAFQVTFAKAPALARSATFTDEVSVTLTASGTTATKQYRLTVSATDLKHQVLQRLPNGKRFVLPAVGRGVSSRTVTLGVNLHPLVGNPYLVRYRVEATRSMLDGTPGSSDDVPNTGTTVWRGSSPLGP